MSETGTREFVRDLRTWPNVVSILRVVLIYVALALFHRGHFALGLGIGIVSGLSDYLDGYLARKLNQSTRIGGLIDQAADILFIVGCTFFFVHRGEWPPILVYLQLFRETMVMNLRASAAEQGFAIPSIFLGKWASNWMFYSLAVMAAAVGHLLPEPANTYAQKLADFGMFVGITSSLITGVIYAKGYVERYRRK